VEKREKKKSKVGGERGKKASASTDCNKRRIPEVQTGRERVKWGEKRLGKSGSVSAEVLSSDSPRSEKAKRGVKRELSGRESPALFSEVRSLRKKRGRGMRSTEWERRGKIAKRRRVEGKKKALHHRHEKNARIEWARRSRVEKGVGRGGGEKGCGESEEDSFVSASEKVTWKREG